MDDKVSKKAIWEGFITSDESPMTATQMRSQPQMMFCYKCNNVIPNNSTFCPYCQIKLFAECPKCGAKYSSQYPACGQCGTNREEYLLAQRREQERKAAIERENTRKRLEEEARERLQKEAYIKENEDIKKTKEYKTTYSILREALNALENKKNKNTKIAWLIFSLIFIYLVISYITDLPNRNSELFGTILIIVILISLIAQLVDGLRGKARKWQEEYLMQYALSDSRYQESLITKYTISMVWYQRYQRYQTNWSECCIIAYRKKHGLTVNYKWHNLR